MPNYSPNQDQPPRTSALRRGVGFTLIELLVVMAIIALLSAAILVALTELQATSKKRRCQQQIKKIDQLIMRRWDEILHKPLPIRFLPLNPTLNITQQRLEILRRKRTLLIARRELLRLEMPERKTDLGDDPTIFPNGSPVGDRLQLPATTSALRRKTGHGTNNWNNWSVKNQGAECLYLILSVMQDRDSSALDFFFPSEIGDTDEDGMPEILDGFGQPIGFLRWAPGFSYRGPPNHNPRHQSRYSDIQDINPVESPDATDMGAADSRLGGNTADDPFNLFPLIVSAGRDGEFGLDLGLDLGITPFRYSQFLNDPFYSTHGNPIDDTILDNISNHQIEVNP
jgi:prepilin-type N-terminal cleavage/methylation domain-containing protein